MGSERAIGSWNTGPALSRPAVIRHSLHLKAVLSIGVLMWMVSEEIRGQINIILNEYIRWKIHHIVSSNLTESKLLPLHDPWSNWYGGCRCIPRRDMHAEHTHTYIHKYIHICIYRWLATWITDRHSEHCMNTDNTKDLILLPSLAKQVEIH